MDARITRGRRIEPSQPLPYRPSSAPRQTDGLASAPLPSLSGPPVNRASKRLRGNNSSTQAAHDPEVLGPRDESASANETLDHSSQDLEGSAEEGRVWKCPFSQVRRGRSLCQVVRKDKRGVLIRNP